MPLLPCHCRSIRIFRPLSWVTAVAFSPDGRLILAGSREETPRLWEVASGKVIASLSGHTDSINAVAFSPDGRLVLTGGSDKTARLWEAPSGKAVATLGHTGWVSAVAFSPDGRLALTGSGYTAFLWDVASRTAIATLSHARSVTAVAFSPNGQLILTGSAERTTRLWETASGKAIATLSEDAGSRISNDVLAVAASPDGRHVLAVSSDGTAQLWPMLAGTQTLVDTSKSIVPRCLTPAQRQRFHLAPAVPRWCYSKQLWPFDDPGKNPPPPTSWDERLVAAWDWMMTKAFSQSEHPNAR